MKIIVSNLNTEATDADLADLFRAHGQVLSAKIMRHSTGQSRGLAIVEMPDAEGEAAIVKLSRSVFMQQPLIIHEMMKA